MLQSTLPHVPTGTPSRARVRLAAALGILVPPSFALVTVALTWADHERLAGYGWRPSDHAGVPWPSSVGTGPFAVVQAASFGVLGATLVALAVALPAALGRGRAARIARASVAAQGLGLLAAAFPLDRPDGDPADVMSWVQSWHAGVHLVGFLVVGVAVVVATAALAVAGRAVPGWRGAALSSGICAPLLVATFAVSTAPAWYAFLLLDLAWITVLANAVRTAGRARASVPTWVDDNGHH